MRYELVPQTPEEKAALEQAPHARVLLEPFLPLVIARALMAFVRLGLARALAERGKNAAELAAELGLREDALQPLLRALVAGGYVTMTHDGAGAEEPRSPRARFGLNALSRATLLDDAPAPLDAWVVHNRVHWRVISSLESVLAADGARDLHHHLQDAGEWAAYQRAMLQTARPVAEPVSRLMPEPARRELLLDLGGAHGLYGAAICRRFAPMRCRVLDLPPALAHARALGQQEGILDLVEYRAGDILQTDLGTGTCDVVFMGNVVHHIAEGDLAGVLRRVHRALRAGGVVAIWDIAPPPDRPELDLVAEGFSLLFYLSSASSCRPPAACVAALNDAGFSGVGIDHGPSPTHVLITARR